MPAKYETIIGLEVHVQLRTKSKMFCSCRSDYQSADPNTLVCPVCLGMPGVLPVINRKAVEYTIATGLALNCNISSLTKFDRKNYPYPDLMKGYQISQYDMPIATDGYLEIETETGEYPIRIIRVHLEEDVAKMQHFHKSDSGSYSLLDVNRAGVPLMEIVGHPDIRSPEQARQYLTSLRSILQYIGVTTGNMEEGSFRCDANISIRPEGSKEFMTRTEVKNMNSFRSVYNALNYEVKRQRGIVEEGGRVIQETRGWVDTKGITVSQRTKEYAHDYRYFPEPDLPELLPNEDWIGEIASSLPELPAHRLRRFVADYGLIQYDAQLLTSMKDTADFFEDVLAVDSKENLALLKRAKTVSNWMLGDVLRLLNVDGCTIGQSKLKPEHLAELVNLVDNGTLSTNLAKVVLENSFKTGQYPIEIAKQNGFIQISDTSVVRDAVIEVINANPKAVDDYIKGKEQAAGFLVGQVMSLTQGKANPTIVVDFVRRELGTVGRDKE